MKYLIVSDGVEVGVITAVRRLLARGGDKVEKDSPLAQGNAHNDVDVLLLRVTAFGEGLYRYVRNTLDIRQCAIVFLCDIAIPDGASGVIEALMGGGAPAFVATTGDPETWGPSLQSAVESELGVTP